MEAVAAGRLEPTVAVVLSVPPEARAAMAAQPEVAGAAVGPWARLEAAAAEATARLAPEGAVAAP
jgi:hypothetical protein